MSGTRVPLVSRAPRLLLGLALGAILYATLTPSYVTDEVPPWWCVACGERGIADFILNIILFIPLGVGLRLNGVRAGRAVASGAILSTFIELTQALVPGRDTTLGDVIANTAGTAVGYYLTDVVLRAARRPSAPLTGLIWAVLALGIVALTGVALTPAYPSSVYYGQWTADLDGSLEWYRGHVLTATLGPLAVPSEQLADQPAVHRLLAAGALVDIHGLAGPRPTRIAPFFSIYDDDRREILLLGVRREDLVVRFRTRSLAWGLDRPYLTLKGALANRQAGDSLHVAMWRQGGRLCLIVNAQRTCDLGFTPGAGWSVLIYPDSLSTWIRALLGAFWVGGILLPAGFTVRSRLGAVVVTGIVVVGLAVVPSIVGLRSTPAIEWVGALAGLGVGRLSRALLSRLPLI